MFIMISFKNESYNNILQELNDRDSNVDNICSICKDPLLIDTIKLSCKHRFHSFCLQETFQKWKTKKCPFCCDIILWDSFKTKCSVQKKDGNICGKSCFNDEKMCSLHVNTFLNKLRRIKESNKDNEAVKDRSKEIKSLNKTLELKTKKIKKLKSEISKLIKEVDEIKHTIFTYQNIEKI